MVAGDPTGFEVAIQALIDVGFYDFFLPFILTSIIIFALLRKSSVLGENVAVNGIISIVIGLLIMGFPVLIGITFTTQFATFFAQIMVWIILLVVAAVMASVFYPNLTEVLKSLKSKNFVFIMLAMALAIFVTSGLVGVFTLPGNEALTGIEPEVPGPPTDIIIILAAIIIFMVLMIVATAIIAGANKK